MAPRWAPETSRTCRDDAFDTIIQVQYCTCTCTVTECCITTVAFMMLSSCAGT